MNTALLDTYQLKSLDGVLEAPVEKMKIRRRRSDGKHFVLVDGLTLSYNNNNNNNNNINASLNDSLVTPVNYDNFALREPYDRIIRCLGFRFNESLFSQ